MRSLLNNLLIRALITPPLLICDLICILDTPLISALNSLCLLIGMSHLLIRALDPRCYSMDYSRDTAWPIEQPADAHRVCSARINMRISMYLEMPADLHLVRRVRISALINASFSMVFNCLLPCALISALDKQYNSACSSMGCASQRPERAEPILGSQGPPLKTY